jgi:hypothetical protein
MRESNELNATAVSNWLHNIPTVKEIAAAATRGEYADTHYKGVLRQYLDVRKLDVIGALAELYCEVTAKNKAALSFSNAEAEKGSAVGLCRRRLWRQWGGS